MLKEVSQSKTVKTISFMAIIIFCAKFMGLLRETLIAGVYGQGYASDVLNTSTQIPLLFFDMTLGVAILSTFVPIFNGYLERDGKERAMAFANNFMSIVVVFAAILSAIGMIFAEPIVKLMVPGYPPEKVLETARLLRILFPSIIFTAAAYTAVGILQSFGEFNIPSIISVVSNLIMILYLFIAGNRFGLTGVVISMFVAWASQLFVQLPHLVKTSYRFRPCINLRDKGIRDAARLAVPVLISSWVQPLCVVINMALGSSMGDGAVSGLNWANKIYIIIVGVFAYAVTNFIFPKLSRFSANGSNDDFAETTRLSLSWIIFIIGYVCAIFVSLNIPIIQIVFERGEFTAENTALTANALFFYSFGMIGYAICEILNKSFYAVQDGKTPMLTSISGVVINILSALFFVKIAKLGIGGLALASAVSSIFMAITLLTMMNKRNPGTINSAFIRNITKIIACSVLCGVFAKIMYRILSFIGNGNFFAILIRFGSSALVALIFYTVLGFFLRLDEAKQIRRFGNAK